MSWSGQCVLGSSVGHERHCHRRGKPGIAPHGHGCGAGVVSTALESDLNPGDSDDCADDAKVYAALLEHCTLLDVQLEAGNDIAADRIGQALGITADTHDRFA